MLNTFYQHPIASDVLDRKPGLLQTLMDLHNDDPSFGKHVRMRSYRSNEVVADAAALRREMFVLMQGRIHLVCTNSEGRRLVIGSLEPGAIFGEGALNSPRQANVFTEADTDVIVWSIPAAEARNMTMQYPILGWGMLQTYGKRLRQVENRLEDVAYKKLPERLAALLIELSLAADDAAVPSTNVLQRTTSWGTRPPSFGQPTRTIGQAQALIQGVSHQDLADRLGTYRETISAILRDFKRQGFVALGYRRIVILNIEEMKEIAGIWEW